METFYLQIEVQKEQTELLEGQRSGYEDDYPTEQDVRTAAPNICQWLFAGRPVKAYLIINRHSAEGNEPCDKELIYEQ